jgi:tripartite-type tricarboxylate transporter receptor subunit TctC
MKTFARVAGTLLLGAAVSALAQAFPSKPVKLVVPYPPGGGTDVLARIVAPKLGEALGQPVIIENKPGAGGTIGAAQAANAAPDGYTLLIVNTLPHTSSAGLYKNLPYDPVASFQAVGGIATVPYVVVVNPNLPAKSFGEFVNVARQKNLNYASAGVGSATHLAAELIRIEGKVPMTHVPYKGGGPAITDTLGGQVDLTVENITSIIGHVKAGKLRALAVTTAQPASMLPEVPTVAASGIPGFDVGGQFGLVVPKGTPPDIITKLGDALAKTVQSPEVAKELRSQGGEPLVMTPAQYDALTKAESAKWLGVIKQAGIKPE